MASPTSQLVGLSKSIVHAWICLRKPKHCLIADYSGSANKSRSTCKVVVPLIVGLLVNCCIKLLFGKTILTKCIVTCLITPLPWSWLTDCSVFTTGCQHPEESRGVEVLPAVQLASTLRQRHEAGRVHAGQLQVRLLHPLPGGFPWLLYLPHTCAARLLLQVQGLCKHTPSQQQAKQEEHSPTLNSQRETDTHTTSQ